MIRRSYALLMLVSLLLLNCCTVLAADEEAGNGLAADTLTIKVGYFGGPYYEKAVFTAEELWAMDVVYADYTLIDNMPGVVIDHVAGVRLSDLMEAAGIDLGSIETFYFWTRDKQTDYYTSYAKTVLLDTPRYCYYSLPDNWDEDAGAGNQWSTEIAEPVDCLIALADDWNRCIAGASFGSDFLNLDTDTRFRLMFGQTNGWERTASRSARWVHEIVVELGGAPVLTLEESVLEGEVGSILRTEAGITADSTILEQETLHWSSSDEAVATVGADGSITLHSEGTAVITAEFAGVTATLRVTGIPGAAEPPPADPGGTETVIAPPAPAEPSAADRVIPTDRSHAPLLSPILPQLETETDAGGVQNWRVYEMHETASELGNIRQETNSLPMVLFAAGLLLLGIVAFITKFYRDIG